MAEVGSYEIHSRVAEEYLYSKVDMMPIQKNK